MLAPDSARAQYNKGNALYHVGSSFNPQRASCSILKAFADARTAFDELIPELKVELLDNGYPGAHVLYSSPKKAVPEYFKTIDVNN